MIEASPAGGARALMRRSPMRRVGAWARTAGIVPLSILILIAASAILAPLITQYGPTDIDPVNRLAGPSWDHWFGTDDLGRDLYTRVLYGGRLSLTIAVVATSIAMVGGFLWGATAALSGGWLDDVLMRFVDATLGIPIVLSALVLVAAFDASLTSLILILGAIHVPPTARVVRAAVLAEKTGSYCLAATAAGASRTRLMFSEILPNIAPPLLVQGAIVSGSVILTEAGLSFLGLGVNPPDASWGTLVFQGYSQLYASYWFIIFPGLVIFVAILALNLLSDNLQTGLGPNVRNGAGAGAS